MLRLMTLFALLAPMAMGLMGCGDKLNLNPKNGVLAGDGSIEVDYDFGEVTVSSSRVRIILIRNTTGNMVESCDEPTMTGDHASEFVVDISTSTCSYGDGFVLYPQDACTIIVTFRPTATGERNALYHYACSGMDYTINFLGQGT